MKRFVLTMAVASLLLLVLAAPALAAKPSPAAKPSRAFLAKVTPSAAVSATDGYVFPSTNKMNKANGWPYVTQLPAPRGSITLQFVNGTNSLAYFEVRIDGQRLTSGDAHLVIPGDFIYDGVLVDGRGSAATVVVTETFAVKKRVEVRLALGGERDWDFNWTPFKVRTR